jgi:hypothetical protein
MIKFNLCDKVTKYARVLSNITEGYVIKVGKL